MLLLPAQKKVFLQHTQSLLSKKRKEKKKHASRRIMLIIISFTQWRARRLGLPAPSLNPFVRNRSRNAYTAPAPAPSGIKGWITNKFNAMRSHSSAGGAYASTGNGGIGRDRRGFGPLDPDEAWDSRVGNEADYGVGYYEEQELGLQDPSASAYAGGGYGHGLGAGAAGADGGGGRSKSQQRELDHRYDEEMGAGPTNPFGDDNATDSLRGMSPRPMVDTQPRGGKTHKSQNSLEADHESPTERRSMFREDV